MSRTINGGVIIFLLAFGKLVQLQSGPNVSLFALNYKVSLISPHPVKIHTHVYVKICFFSLFCHFMSIIKTFAIVYV